jgi:hypothetical protein
VPERKYAGWRTGRGSLQTFPPPEVWNLSQSIADFARKSPASIERSGADVEKEKAQAYKGLWTGATPLA